jgi:hypothetical protein
MQVVIMLTMHVRAYDVSNFDYITVSEKVFAGWAAASVVNELQQVHNLRNVISFQNLATKNCDLVSLTW